MSSIMTWGLAESAIVSLMKNLDAKIQVHPTHIEVQIPEKSEVQALSQLGDHAFSSEGKRLEEVVAELLFSSGETVAVAESCTGGRLASKLTAIPGSSKYFKSGLITYSDESKTQLLDVPPFVIKKAGAVSQDTALAMAVGLARKSGCDYCLSITGIAGPDGGTPEKPVGLVHMALAAPSGPSHQVFQFKGGDRNEIQDRAAQAALFMLYLSLAGLPIPDTGDDRATLSSPPPTL